MKRTEAYAGIKNLTLKITDQLEEIAPIMHALSTPLRLQIIRLLSKKSMNVNELAQLLDVPMSTISLNVSVLEKANLILTESQPAARGTMKLCSRITDHITLSLVAMERRPKSISSYSVPVGSYAEAEGIRPMCGLAGPEGSLGIMDNPASFYLPERMQAQLLWLTTGFLTYRLPTMPFGREALEWLEISFEACSEAINYRNEYPSDISLEVNGKHIGTWRSPGDFGGRRGVLNPEWWSDVCTQYGQLKTWHIDHEGSRLDHERISGVTLDDLGLEGDYFTLRIGVHPDAAYPGGLNLFGAGFGDYPQDIVVKFA